MKDKKALVISAFTIIIGIANYIMNVTGVFECF